MANYTIIINHKLELSGTRVKYLDHEKRAYKHEILGRLDLAVLFTPSTPNRQNRNQVRWNSCAGVRRSTPSSEVV